jgi:hypothetical protein
MKRKLKIAACVVVALIAPASAQLGTAEQFIETVDNRAPFANLDRDRAEAACKALKRVDMSCISILNAPSPVETPPASEDLSRLDDGALMRREQRVTFARDVTDQCFKKHQFDGFHANAVAAYCRDIADRVAGRINVSMMRRWPHWSEGELQSFLPVLAPAYGKLTVRTPGFCHKAGCARPISDAT